jgi:hypothetical protein
VRKCSVAVSIILSSWSGRQPLPKSPYGDYAHGTHTAHIKSVVLLCTTTISGEIVDMGYMSWLRIVASKSNLL